MNDRVLHMRRIFSVHVYVQVRELDRPLSFYRNALGLRADRNDGTIPMLRGRGDSGHTLVIRRIGDHAVRHSLGEVGVSPHTGSSATRRGVVRASGEPVHKGWRHSAWNSGPLPGAAIAHGPHRRELSWRTRP